MKLKRSLGIVVACTMLLCSFNTSVQAIGQATGRFSMDVPANTTRQANTSFPLEAGETVRINASYTPNVSVDFGLIDEDGIFHFLTVTSGSIDKTIRIAERGNYTFAVRNNASVVISVSGYVTY